MPYTLISSVCSHLVRYEYTNPLNIAERKDCLADAKRLVTECKKSIATMDYLWGGLDPSDKGYYKSELTDFKSQLEKVTKGEFILV